MIFSFQRALKITIHPLMGSSLPPWSGLTSFYLPWMVQITAGSFPSQVHLYEMQMVFLFHFSFQKPHVSGIRHRPLTMFVFGLGTKANFIFIFFFAVLRQRNYKSRQRWQGLSGCMTITVKINLKGMLSGPPDAFSTASGDVWWRQAVAFSIADYFKNEENDGH